MVFHFAKPVAEGSYIQAALDANEDRPLTKWITGPQIAGGVTDIRFPDVAPGSYTSRLQAWELRGYTLDPADAFNTNKTIEVRSGETTTVTWDGALR